MQNISQALTKSGHFEGAFETVKTILDESVQLIALQNIFLALASLDRLDEATNMVANALHNDQHALRGMCERLAVAGHLGLAIELANTIPDEAIKIVALQESAETLTRLQRFDDAIQMAKAIPNEHQQSLALLDISNVLTKLCRKTAEMIPEAATRALALKYFSHGPLPD